MMVDILLAAMTVLLTLVLIGNHTRERISQTRQHAHKAVRRWREQKARVRKQARLTLALKRELRHQQMTADALEEDCQQLEAEIRKSAHPGNRIFVLEERRTITDTAWVGVVNWRQPPSREMASREAAGDESDIPSGRPKPVWQRRQFMVWAPDANTAQSRLARRFPAIDGYSVEGVAPREIAPPAGKPPHPTAL